MDVACDSAQLWGQQGDLLRSGHPAALNACWLVGDAPADTLLACDPAPCRQGIKLSLGFYEDILVPEFALQVGAAAHIKLPVLGRTAMHAHPCGSVCAGGGGGGPTTDSPGTAAQRAPLQLWIKSAHRMPPASPRAPAGAQHV